MEIFSIVGLMAGLAASAFLAGSILPFPSEAALAAAILQSPHTPIALVMAAGIGNTIGAITNWWLGTRLERYKDRSWFPVKPEALQRAQTHYQKYGYWTLLLAWVPIVGDPLTVIAGVMHVPLWLFAIVVGSAKFGRYAIVAAAIS